MTFIESSKIYAFPVGTRGSEYPLARLTTEQNLVNIIRSITDINSTNRNGFVINDAGIVDMDSSLPVEFVVGGYYFRTIFSALPKHAVGDGNTLYACVNLTTTGSYPATYNQEMAAQDDTNVLSTPVSSDMNQVSDPSTDSGSNFVGISFTWEDTKPSSDSFTYAIPLVNYSDEYYYLKEEYRYRLNRDSVNMEWITPGESP